jgi:arylsulfatase A-like enzyme
LENVMKSGRPFLGVVHLNTNHYPYNTRPQYQRWSGSDVDLYDNTVLEVDTHTRRLIETLEAAGRLENTIVVFASDHGEAFNEHGYIAHFYCHFTETVSVPMWIYLPPSFTTGREVAAMRANLGHPVQNLDLLPTLLDCLGAWDRSDTAALREPMLGSSLLRPLPPGRTLFITNKDETIDSVIGLSSIKGWHHYMLRTSSTPAKEDLFDMESDPHERHNLWPVTSPAERDTIRREFLRFPVAAATMRAAFPELKE